MKSPKKFFPEFFDPFDEVYRRVTAKIEKHIRELSHRQTAEWLEALVREFQNERDRWPSMLGNDYFQACQRLKPSVLHLAACAYAHISFDLPRVPANEWPMLPPRWQKGPTEDEGEDAYFQLTRIFPETFEEVKASTTVMGRFASFTQFAPKDSMAALGHWALHLRTAAWIHARRLKNCTAAGRQYREEKMLEAMTKALGKVSNRKLWSASVLYPPHDDLNAKGLVPVIAIAASDISPGLLSFLGALLGSLAIFFWWRKARRAAKLDDELTRFIHEFGQTLIDYMDVAVRNPEGFDSYVAERAATEREIGENRGEPTPMG